MQNGQFNQYNQFNQNGQFGQYNQYNQYNNGFDFSRRQAPRYDNSRVWFAVAVPIIALFIEAFSATSFKLGVIVWVTAVAALYLACIADWRYLKKAGAGDMRLGGSLILPHLYIYKRGKNTGMGAAPFVILVILTIYAAVNNGFVQVRMMDDDDKLAYVQDSSVAAISGLEDIGGSAALESIKDRLEAYADGDEIKWSERESSGRITVVAECKKFRLVFAVSLDGFALSDLKVTECTVNGKSYTGEDMTAELKNIFGGESSSSAESGQESAAGSSSSENDNVKTA